MSAQSVTCADMPVTTISEEKSGLLGAFLLFMLPVLLDCVLQSLSGTISNIYIGHLLGAKDLAAASTFYPLLLVLVSCGVGLGTGASVLVGQKWGAGAFDQARTAVSAAISLSLVFGGAIAILGQWGVIRMLWLFSVPTEIAGQAEAYCRIFLAGTPALVLLITVAITLRGAGDNIRPLAMMGVQILISIVATPVLIVSPLGVSGAAVTGIVGWIVSLVFVGCWLRVSRHPLAPCRAMMRELLPTPAVLRSVVRLGFPAMIEIATQGLAEVILVGRINSFGPDMTAAYGLFTQTLTYIEFPGMAVGITVSVLCSHAIGARQPERARAVLRVGFIVGLMVTGLLASIVSFEPAWVSGLFTSDPQVMIIANHAFRAVMWSAVLLSLGGILGAAMRANGDTIPPMAIMLGCILMVELPAGYLFAKTYGAWGVWLGYTASFSSIFLASALYWLVIWRHRPLTPIG